ncbi:MAG TPA: hypothetical protein VGR00_11250 [Thermoanaerobaculia bacterium]|nr:hypothetical protein [Thermoanaerobaculia bacterium]
MKFVWAVLACVSLGSSRLASGCDCTGGAPFRFEAPIPNPYPLKFVTGFTTSLDLYGAAGNRRVLVRENYGYSVFSLSNPAMPSYLAASDIEGQPGYEQAGDGFSTVGDVAAVGDGSRILVNYTSNHGTLLMSPQGAAYTFAGEFGISNGSVALAKVGARYLGFNLKSTGLAAADVTSFVVGPNATLSGSISYAAVPPPAVGSSAPPVAAGSYIVYQASVMGTGVEVVNISNPGFPGAGLALNFTTQFVPASTFGLTSVFAATAAIHPTDGMLYVLAEGMTAGTPGAGLARSANGSAFTQVGSVFSNGPTYTSAVGVSTMAATASDLVVLFWGRNPGNGVNKLFTMTTSAFGTDLTPAVTVDPAVYTDFPRAYRMRAFSSGTQVYAYIGAQQAGYAMSLTCLALADVIAPTVSAPASAAVTQTICQ